MWCLSTVIFQENAKFQLEAKVNKGLFFPLAGEVHGPLYALFLPPISPFLCKDVLRDIFIFDFQALVSAFSGASVNMIV